MCARVCVLKSVRFSIEEASLARDLWLRNIKKKFAFSEGDEVKIFPKIFCEIDCEEELFFLFLVSLSLSLCVYEKETELNVLKVPHSR